jgi:hypothetical protein
MNDKPEQQQSSQPTLPPPPSPDEQRAKEKAASYEKIISGCSFAGAATFFVLNFATGVVPGGFIGGAIVVAIGGGLGAVVGMIIVSLRGR